MQRTYLRANATIYFVERTNHGKLAEAAEGQFDVINIGEPHGTNT